VFGEANFFGTTDETVRLLAHISNVLAENGVFDLWVRQEVQPRSSRVLAVVVRLQPSERLHVAFVQELGLDDMWSIEGFIAVAMSARGRPHVRRGNAPGCDYQRGRSASVRLEVAWRGLEKQNYFRAKNVYEEELSRYARELRCPLNAGCLKDVGVPSADRQPVNAGARASPS
jgi:hypothetical protein